MIAARLTTISFSLESNNPIGATDPSNVNFIVKLEIQIQSVIKASNKTSTTLSPPRESTFSREK